MPRTPVHPGQYIADELEEFNINAHGLSDALGISVNVVDAIIAERSGITAEVALRIGRWLGTGPDVWINLQKTYELRRAQLEIGDEIERTVTPLSAA